MSAAVIAGCAGAAATGFCVFFAVGAGAWGSEVCAHAATESTASVRTMKNNCLVDFISCKPSPFLVESNSDSRKQIGTATVGIATENLSALRVLTSRPRPELRHKVYVCNRLYYHYRHSILGAIFSAPSTSS